MPPSSLLALRRRCQIELTLFLYLAPLEENSDAESFGGSIPFQTDNAPKPQDDANDAANGSNDDEDEGEDDEEGL